MLCAIDSLIAESCLYEWFANRCLLGGGGGLLCTDSFLDFPNHPIYVCSLELPTPPYLAAPPLPLPSPSLSTMCCQQSPCCSLSCILSHWRTYERMQLVGSFTTALLTPLALTALAAMHLVLTARAASRVMQCTWSLLHVLPLV